MLFTTFSSPEPGMLFALAIKPNPINAVAEANNFFRTDRLSVFIAVDFNVDKIFNFYAGKILCVF